MTERVLSLVQAAEMGFLRRVHGVTLCDKVRSCEILQALIVDTFLLPCHQIVPGKNGEAGKSC